MHRCAAIKANGERCKADAMSGAEWCYSHHPDRAEQRSRNASRGGKSGGRGRSNNELGEVLRTSFKAWPTPFWTGASTGQTPPCAGSS